MSKMEWFLVGFLVAGFIGLIIYKAAIDPKLSDYKNLTEHLADERKVELSHQGGGMLYKPPGFEGEYFNYNIRSWDGGKTWYAVEFDKDENLPTWGLTILGSADTLYPGLLEHIEGMAALTKYVEEHGTIDGTDPAGIEALENAGFTVEITEKGE